METGEPLRRTRGLLGLTALEFQLLPATHHKGDHEAVNKPQVVAFR